MNVAALLLFAVTPACAQTVTGNLLRRKGSGGVRPASTNPFRYQRRWGLFNAGGQQ